jgi:hypothetical protein
MSRTSLHAPPPKADLEENAQFEPEGERIRKELIEFLERNRIASIYLDTEKHVVDIQSAALPPKVKNVLSHWGSVYVVDDSPDVVEEWVRSTRPADWDDNRIPPMTHPLSRGWSQPDTALIAIDATTARMPVAVFRRLMEYSTTMPSGVYEGKMWKAHVPVQSSQEPQEVWTWFLRWYGYSKIVPGHVSNNQRRIVLTDGGLPG